MGNVVLLLCAEQQRQRRDGTDLGNKERSRDGHYGLDHKILGCQTLEGLEKSGKKKSKHEVLG